MARSPLERAAGIGTFLEIRGKRYECSAISVNTLGKLHAYLCSRVADPLQELARESEALSKFPPEVQKALAVRALELREANRANMLRIPVAEWGDNLEGAIFLFWSMVKATAPEFPTLESVREAFPPEDETRAFSNAECELIYRTVQTLVFPEANATEPTPAVKKKLRGKLLVKKAKKAKRR